MEAGPLKPVNRAKLGAGKVYQPKTQIPRIYQGGLSLWIWAPGFPIGKPKGQGNPWDSGAGFRNISNRVVAWELAPGAWAPPKGGFSPLNPRVFPLGCWESPAGGAGLLPPAARERPSFPFRFRAGSEILREPGKGGIWEAGRAPERVPSARARNLPAKFFPPGAKTISTPGGFKPLFRARKTGPKGFPGIPLGVEIGAKRGEIFLWGKGHPLAPKFPGAPWGGAVGRGGKRRAIFRGGV